MKEEDKLLVEQAKNGSERAFNSLYNRYKKNIWFVAFKIVHNTDVADDIVSQVFMKVHLKLKTFTQHISFARWIETIAINTAIDYTRRTKKEKLNNYIDDEECKIQLEETEHSPEDKFIFKQNVEVVMECLSKLKKQYRDLIYLRLDGKSYHQISEELAIPEATVKTQLSKARRRLRELFNKYH